MTRFSSSLGLAGLMLLAGTAARASGQAMPWDDGLDAIVSNLTGPVAIAAGVLGLFGIGFKLLYGDQFSQAGRLFVNVVIAVGLMGGGVGLLNILLPGADGASYEIVVPVE